MASEFNIKNGFISNNNSIVQGTLTATTIVATTYLNLPYSGSASGTTNYLSKFTGTNSIGDSIVYDNGTNVGIGKTNPSVKLDVIGDIRSNGTLFGSTSQVNNIQTNGQNLSIKGVGSTLVTIDQTSGYVGIGTTSPSTTLQVSSSTNLGVVIGTSVYPNWMGTNGLYVDGSFRANNYLLNSGGGINWGASQAKIIGYNPSFGSDTYLSFFTGGISANGERIRIIDNGNVGIGTTTPLAKLDVQGSITATTNLAKGVNISNNLISSANNDVLVGLDIASTFTLGAFTNVGQYHLRIASPPTNGYSIFLVGNATINGSNQMNLSRNGAAVFGSSSLETNVSTAGPNVPLKFTLSSGALEFGRFAATTGNFLLGTTSDGGAKLQISGSINPTSTVARGASISPTLVATANNDTLIGLDINPTFSGGSFTGVTSTALRVAGNIIPSTTATYDLGTTSIKFRDGWFSRNLHAGTTWTNNIAFETTNLTVYNSTGSDIIGKWFGNGNLLIQTGGTFTDISSAKLQINSTTQGVLLPRMTTSQINGIVSPVQGLTVFNTDLNTLCFYTTSWQKVTNTAM